ncbi:MAG: pyrroline-5-carboxylate reductase family protein [Bacteriovoracaceae bacterium]
MKKFLILGCGNMAQALTLGFHQREKNPSFSFFFYTPSGVKAKFLAEKTGGLQITELKELSQYDFVMIACKPQQFKELSISLQGKLSPQSVVVSIMAGISVEGLKRDLGHSKIIRVMPNTPSLIGEGSNLVYYSKEILSQEKLDLEHFLKAEFAPHVFQNEEQVNQVTGVIASGPAYVFEFARIMVDYLQIQCQISSSESNLLVKELFLGSAHLMMNSETSLEELRNQVTSKGGVTFAALESFRQAKLSGIFSDAFQKAYERNKELSEANFASK